ncbi:MAG TPA: DUF4404 family protein [Myxococcota bacterium]|nr:DUF4404 family protein [Myxococcota bacterium]
MREIAGSSPGILGAFGSTAGKPTAGHVLGWRSHGARRLGGKGGDERRLPHLREGALPAFGEGALLLSLRGDPQFSEHCRRELAVPTESHKLQETLEGLRAELGAETSLDPQLRARLEHTIKQIQDAIDRAVPGTKIATDGASLTERLSESARHFEATHPDIAAALGRVIDALAALGI